MKKRNGFLYLGYIKGIPGIDFYTKDIPSLSISLVTKEIPGMDIYTKDITRTYQVWISIPSIFLVYIRVVKTCRFRQICRCRFRKCRSRIVKKSREVKMSDMSTFRFQKSLILSITAKVTFVLFLLNKNPIYYKQAYAPWRAWNFLVLTRKFLWSLIIRLMD